jgi:general secretion pathway protein D
VILAYPPTNMLIVTDVFSNIQRLVKILKAIDVTGIGREISIIPLRYSDAGQLVKLLDTIFRPILKPKKGAAQKAVKLVADERTNTVIIFASKDETAKIKDLIKMLDKELPRGKENFHVVYLAHATAEDLAKVLQELPDKKGTGAKGKKAAPVISEKVKITADKATNSLIIMAEKDDYAVIVGVIKKLDIPRSMVYIESLIMEVDTDKDFSLGTEWTAAGEANYGSKNAAIGSGFSGGDPGSQYANIGGLVGAGVLPAGFSLGTFTEVIEIAGVEFANIAAIIQAFKKDRDVNILSTPQILTTDNQEAKIVIGKNVAFQTRSNVAGGTTETYASYEYRDVGTTLKITPQISENRMVRLTISHELTKLDELSTASLDRPATLKRTIDTTVVVKDGSTVVIGGLIDDALTETEYKVPCLGDVPFLGWLFKSVSVASEKTNLYVFLTPRVVKSPKEAKELYQDKKIKIDKIEEGRIKMYEKIPDQLKSDVPK